MKTLILSILTGLISFSLNAQINLDWAFNVSPITYFGYTCLDNNGNVYIAGSDNGSITINKYSSTGSLLDSLSIPANISINQYINIQTDGSNNLIVTGHFNGVTDFCPGIGTYNLTGNNSSFLAKYSNNLSSLLFVVKTNDNCRPTAIDIDNSNNIYISSNTTNNIAKVEKFNSTNGNLIWSFSLDLTGGAICINGIDVNDIGELYISGSMYNPSGYPDFDPSANTFTNISGPVFFAKYDTSSNFIWAKGISTAGDAPNTFIKYFNGKVFVASKGSGDIDPNPSVFNVNGTFFIGQYNSSNGDIVPGWGREIKVINPGINTDQQISDLEVNPLGDIFVSGNFETGDSIDFNVISSGGIYAATGTYEGFITGYDFNNNYIGGFVLPTTLNSYPNSLAINNDTIYVGGYYYGITDFDPNGTYNLTASGNPELFLARYTVSKGTVGIAQLSDNSANFCIYPNPVQDKLNILTQQNNKATLVKVYNSFGEIVKEMLINNDLTTINLSDFSVGLYLYQISDRNGNILNTGKFLKE